MMPHDMHKSTDLPSKAIVRAKKVISRLRSENESDTFVREPGNRWFVENDCGIDVETKIETLRAIL